MERKRLVLMQWGVGVAMVSAVGALLMPLAVHALADEAAAEAATQAQIGALLTKTGRLEEAQKHILKDVDELRGEITIIRGEIKTIQGDIRTIEGDVKEIRAQVAANTAALERIGADVRVLLSRSAPN